MRAFTYEQQGGFHAWEGCPCQDRVFALQQGDVECVTLCDGAGSLSGAAEAAQAFSREMGSWLAERFHTSLFGLPEEAVRELAIREIDRILTRLTAGVEAARDLYGCTLLSVCRDRATGEALVMQLGDGVILAWTHADGCRCLTLPEQGEALRSTWLVNSGQQALREHLRVLRLRPGKSPSAYCLLSDGGEGPLYMPRPQSVELHPVLDNLIPEYLLRPGSFAQAMPEFVRKQLRPTDDFSIGVLGDAPAPLLALGLPPRRLRRYAQYLSARRAGCSRIRAARQAGWRKRDLPKHLKRLQAARIEEV